MQSAVAAILMQFHSAGSCNARRRYTLEEHSDFGETFLTRFFENVRQFPFIDVDRKHFSSTRLPPEPGVRTSVLRSEFRTRAIVCAYRGWNVVGLGGIHVTKQKQRPQSIPSVHPPT